MATLAELDRSLPNGFHDAEVGSCVLDFVARTATFELQIWIGDRDALLASERELYRAARLVVTGLAFCQFEPPDPNYPFLESRPLRVDLSDSDPSNRAIRALPEGVFSGRFYVSNWNAFIQLAGREAELLWMSDV